MLWGFDRKVCPKTGKVYQVQARDGWYKWIWPITGFLATVWFLIRVIPKPSRATYPCQRMAFPIASSFVAYLIGIFTTTAILGRARAHLKRAKYAVAAVCLCAAIVTAWFTIGVDAFRAEAGVFVPSDLPNSPMGVARGIYPGRVVWVHDPDVTDWSPSLNNQTTEFWWDDDHTDQAVVDEMYSKGVRWLTNSTTDEEAWDKLFRSFNQRKGKGDVGYTAGEKIAIKPNHVQQRNFTYADVRQDADQSPQMVVALLKQLVWKAGVPQDCISISDSSRYISNKEFNRCYALFPNVHYYSTNYYTANGDFRYADPNRPPVVPSTTSFTYYSGTTLTGNPIPATAQPMPFVEAEYAVNLAIMKGHSTAGATLCGKNWYGNFCSSPGSTDPENTAHALMPDITPSMGHYRLIVDLMGNRNFGEKCVLFVLDGLWGFQHHGGTSRPIAFNYPPFNDDYPSSLLMSQDMVAIDSVGVDMLRAQFADNMGGSYGKLTTGIDDYLHEAAMADNPPSGTVYGYEPNGVQKRFPSLGVHEHWNNHIDKKYTRNLGTSSGIELVSSDPLIFSGSSVADVTEDGRVDFQDFADVVQAWPATAEMLTNGAFIADMAGWTLVHPTGSTGTVTAAWDGTVGNPSGAVRLDKTSSTAATDGHRLYQMIPVTNGSHYRLRAQWKGTLGTVGTNWAEVYVGFANSVPTLTAEWGSAMYKKQYPSSPKNIPAGGTWDWEEITASMNGTSPAGGLSDGVFKATSDYMLVSFNIGGKSNSSAVHYWVDNVSVHEVGSDPAGDVTGDWNVDWFDILKLADEWLDCGLVDGGACLN